MILYRSTLLRNYKPFDAIVLGSAADVLLAAGSNVFYKEKTEPLSETTNLVVFSGSFGRGDAMQLVKGQYYPKFLQPVVDRFKPRHITGFPGFTNMKQLNFFERFVFKDLPIGHMI